MSRNLRMAILWIMVLVMPLQAVAASVMRMCMHADIAGPVVSLVHADCHGSAIGETPSASSTAAADAEASSDGTAPAGAATCSACAACCSMMVLPADPELPANTTAAQAEPNHAVAPVVSQLQDRLDRPPRQALA